MAGGSDGKYVIGRTTRRSFLARLLGATLLTGAAGMVAAVVAYLFPSDNVRSALGPRRVKIGKLDDFSPGQGKLVLVDEEPVWVVRLGKQLTGMSAWCTHRGCIVRWDQDGRLFRCPCHEGLFDERGNVVSGLPLRPLRRFRVGLVHGDLYISSDERGV